MDGLARLHGDPRCALVDVCVCMCMYVCVCVCMCLYVCVCVCMCEQTQIASNRPCRRSDIVAVDLMITYMNKIHITQVKRHCSRRPHEQNTHHLQTQITSSRRSDIVAVDLMIRSLQAREKLAHS